MMSTGKLCGIAIIIVVICPIILGMVWPTGTEDVDTWETEPAIDVTGDLADDTIDVYDTYTGPLNNLSIYTDGTGIVYPTPVATTDSPNSYPISTITRTATITTSWSFSSAADDVRRTFEGQFVYSGDGGTYIYGDYWRATNTFIAYDSDSIPHTFTPSASDRVTAVSSYSLNVFTAPTTYYDLTQGLQGSSTSWIWLNGLRNESVTMWVKLLGNAPFQIYNVVTLTKAADGTVTASTSTDSEALGSAYEYYQIEVSKTGSVTVTGLIGVENFADTSFTLGNSASFTVQTSSASDIVGLQMRGAYSYWWVHSTQSVIGSTKGMSDASLVPESYYAEHAWQVQIINPSVIGDSLTLALGTAEISYAIDGGSITVENMVTQEESQQAIRSMRILSLLMDGQQTVYINGVQVMSGTPSTCTLSFDGQWYTSVVLAKVTQDTTTKFIWNVGDFGFDQQSFCLVGLLSCVAVAIAGSIWGRKSGASVLALHITMILCGIAFLVMMD